MNPPVDALPAPPNGLGQPTTTDPVIAALLAAGMPVQGQGQAPMPGLPLDTSPGPVTSPDQVPNAGPPLGAVPVAPAPTAPAGAPASAAYAPSPVTLGRPLPAGDVKDADLEQGAALNSDAQGIASAELAKADALTSHANARAGIMDAHATAQGLVDQQYQVAREKARADANAETAVWMRDLDKKVAEEPVPGRWWANQTKFGQVMYLLSLSFGAMAQAKNPNLKNIALEMITKETEEDMAEQKDRIKRQIEGLKMKGQVIDQRLQAQLADARDDHTLLAARLAMVQQSSLERANAPGSADQKAAMAAASQWAGQQRFVIAGERANRAYAEREAQLGRDAENARAFLTDKRDRDIAAATIQKDYDLAKISANAKISAREDPRLKDSVVLNPETTGIRVMDDKNQPVATPLSANGGLTVSKANEKEARQTAEVASEKYAAMRRVSDALGKDEDINVLLKRNPQLISDIVKLGYGSARTELDPNGRVTDKDFVAGLEHELGGDLETLKGRVAAASGISANQEVLKSLVDKHLRDYPSFVSNKLGSLLDAAIPGYEGKVRVDWTPKSVEVAEPQAATTQQTDATYGIKTPIEPPKTLDELKQAQALEKSGVQALPPYRPGSQDKVLKALEDFKGAMPETIINRAGAAESQLAEAGDQRAVLEIQQAQYDAVKKSNASLEDVTRALGILSQTDEGGVGTGRHYLTGEEARLQAKLSNQQRSALVENHEVPVQLVVDLAKAHGITQLTGADVKDIISKVGLRPFKE